MSNKQTGQSIIEILIVVGIMAVFLPALLLGLTSSRGGKAQQSLRVQALTLLKEGVEAVRVVREKGWTNVSSLNPVLDYHPAVVGSSWSLITPSEVIGGIFTRTVKIENVYRDLAGNITLNTIPPNVLDPSTKRFVVTVSWSDPYPSAVQSTLYISRYLANGSVTETSQAEFNAGVKTGVVVTNNSGGEISLGSADTGRSDWCVPNVLSNKLNLPKNNAARSIWANPFEAFVGLGVNTTGPSMVKVAISNPAAPAQAVPSLSGTFGAGYNTNHIYGVGNFSYLATNDNAKEVVIVQKIGANFSEIGTFNAAGNINADSVFVVGIRGFMTQGNNLRIFDLSGAQSGSRAQLGTATFGTIANITGKVFVRGNYAYVAIRGDAREFEVFNVTTNTPVKVAWADVNGAAAQDIFVNPDGDRAYMVTNFDASLPEFFVIDTTNKNLPLHQLPAPIGTYNTLNSMSPTAVEVVLADYRAVLVGAGGEEYTVLSLVSENSPARCGGVDIGQTIYDISAVKEPDGDAYGYITTSRTAADDFEFRMVEGGPGPLLAPEGTFESTPQTFAASTFFNRFKAVFDQPVGTSVKFRVAVAATIAGNCNHNQYDFLGPNGSPTTYFETATTGVNVNLTGVIPYLNSGNYLNPERCFKYRVYLYPNSAMTVSPTLKDFTVSYTP